MPSCLPKLKRRAAALPAKNVLALSLLAAFAPGFAATTTVPTGTVVNNVGDSFLGTLAAEADILNVLGMGAEWNNTGDMLVGYHGSGTLNIENGGLVSNNYGSVGSFADGIGAVLVSGAGSQWNNTGNLLVGDLGTGALRIENGGVVRNNYGYAGAYVGSTGTVLVTGAGSQWNNSLNFFVGLNGTGAVNVEDGGVLRNNYGYVGYHAAGTGVIKVSGAGSQWVNSYSLYVGNSGAGTMIIEDGGQVANQYGGVGYYAGSNGTVKVTGVGSQWNNADNLSVGVYGTGALSIENGAVVRNNYGYIGSSDIGSVGAVLVTGAGSEWRSSNHLYVGLYGSGVLNIENGGLVTNQYGGVGYYAGSSGTVKVTGVGSQWNNADNLSVGVYGTGAVSIENGGVVRNNYGYIGSQTTSSVGAVLVTGAGSEWRNSSHLYVGFYGSGTLNIENGGVVANQYGGIGYYAGSNGAAKVSGVGSRWSNAANFSVGASGTGTLEIENGGSLHNNFGYIGVEQSSFGAVVITGAGSAWRNNYDLYVGVRGAGAMNIENGGLVSNTWGYVGRFSGGAVTVTGAGSQWNSAGYLIVGERGNGSLSIKSGGRVSNTLGYVGGYSGTTGTGMVSVAGAGSQWSNSEDLAVGIYGKGSLSIESGGLVSNASGYVGRDSGGSGTVTVTGVGSKWSNTEDLAVGVRGKGFLSIENGGLVSNASGYVGRYSGGSGSVTVTGAGSQWNNSAVLRVGGNAAPGILSIENGGLVTSNGTADFDQSYDYIDTVAGFIGYEVGSIGMVKVSGAGSEWKSNLGGIVVGYEGTGTLIVENGGVVNDGFGSWIGWQPGSNGSVIVTGAGSQWNSSSLSVGTYGAGNLQIESGGVVNSGGGVVANGGISAVKVTGSGSQWNIDDFFLVSGRDDGRSTLNIENGGVVSSKSGYVLKGRGVAITGNGNVTVNGIGSQWNSENITVSDSGRLHIENGGVVSSNYGFIGVGDLSGAVKITGAGSHWHNAAHISIGGSGSTLSILDSAGVTTQTLMIGNQGMVNLGEGAQLATVDGAVSTGTVTFNGDTSIEGNFTNNGSVVGTAGTLRFLHDVNGAGSYAGNIVFQGAFNPGNSPAAINFNGGNVTFDSTSVLNMEIFGDTAGGQYDQLLNIGTLTINGTLNLVFGSGYVPLAGSTITLFGYDTLIGSFGTAADGYDRITVTGYDRTKLGFSNLNGTLSMSVTAVPEPHTYAMVLSGLVMVGALARRRRAVALV